MRRNLFVLVVVFALLLMGCAPAARTYIDMLKHDVATIVAALK
jgi:hypothetical protein